jgi:hypothetical protein
MDEHVPPTEAPAPPAKPRPAKKTPQTGRVSRRTVVLAAGAAAGGLAISRVLGLHKIGPDPLALINPTSPPIVNTKDWVSPLDKTEAQVAQLLRRATFGMTKAQYDAALADGFKNTVDKLIETPAAMPKDLAGADAASQDKPINVTALQSWWLDQMLSTPTPFAERMTYFWHGHFTSDYRKVTTQAPYIYWQNLTWRKNALGGFRDMLYRSPSTRGCSATSTSGRAPARRRTRTTPARSWSSTRWVSAPSPRTTSALARRPSPAGASPRPRRWSTTSSPAPSRQAVRRRRTSWPTR